MAAFTKTKIVDIAGGADYTKIKDALDYFAQGNPSRGGVVVVEEGTYPVGSGQNDDKIEIPSNVALIGRGNVIIEVNDATANAMKNRDTTNGNDRIFVSGFRVKAKSGSSQHLLYFTKLRDSVVEKVFLDGITITSNGPYAGVCLYQSCTGNRISQCTVKAFPQGMLVSRSCDRNTIAQNEILECKTGIYVYGERVSELVVYPCYHNTSQRYLKFHKL